MNRQKGFSIVEVVIVVAIVVVVGLIGWRLWQHYHNGSNSQPNASVSSQTGQAATKPINNAQDLDKASQQMSGVNVDGDYSKQLDQQTAF